MEQKNVKIKIGDREYPLVLSANDEVRMREAEKLINERLLEYRKLYPTADKTDVLAMTALFLANTLLAQDANKLNSADHAIEAELERIRQLISK
jgi:cell division protein ZapA